MEIKKVPIGDSSYPSLLKQIFDPPGGLYYLGDLTCLAAPCVAVVGTRTATAYGTALAYYFAKELAGRGVTIVSGLAFGIDAAAHRGALEAGGRTVAVLAQALPEICPPSHTGLAREILEKGGALISEKEPGGENYKSDYLVRNRIISGVSMGVLVVEAGLKSGARNTAKHALDQNRELMALPGRITDEQSQGANQLIATGAYLVSSPEEVAAILEIPWKKKGKGPLLGSELLGQEKEVFEEIRKGAKTAAELVEKLGGQLPSLYKIIAELEFRGFVKMGPGGRYAVSGADSGAGSGAGPNTS